MVQYGISKVELSLYNFDLHHRENSFCIIYTTMYCNVKSNALNATVGFVTLEGSRFKDPYLVTPIVIAGFCSIAFVVLVITSWRKKVASEWSRKKLAVLSSILIGMFM